MEEIKRCISFVLNGERFTVNSYIKQLQNWKTSRTVELKPATRSMKELSLTADYTGGGGQCQDSIRELAEGFPMVIELLDIWDRWHLNGMKAGTTDQNNALDGFTGDYTAQMKRLQDAGLLIDCGYKYGSAWLAEPIPAKVLKRLDTIMTELDGKRLGEAPDVSDAPDVSETDDTIDSRDVIKRLEIYREAVIAAGLDPETERNYIEEPEDAEVSNIWEEYHDLKELEEEASSVGDWSFGATLIHSSYFADYAEELCKDIGDMPREIPSYIVIDWDATAENLKVDYTTVKFKDQTFYVR